MHWPKATSLVLLFALDAHAQGFEFIPKWKLLDFADGSQKACYEFDQAKELAMLDVDLQTFTKLKVQLPLLQEAHTKQVKALQEQAEAEKQKAIELEAQRNALEKALRVSETENIKLKNDPVAAAGWVVAAGVVLLGVGVFGGMALSAQPKP